MTELHNRDMEQMIEGLADQIERTNRIIHGDPDIGLGVLARLADQENKTRQILVQIGQLTAAIDADREQRAHENEIKSAVEAARTETIERFYKLVQLLGPVLGGGLGINIALELVKLLGGA